MKDREEKLGKEIESVLPLFRSCRLCPRKCGADRTRGQLGICWMPMDLRCGRAALHFWEEPCISGTEGSGTVFFSGCSLHCVFCQNETLSEARYGKEVSLSRLIDIFFSLEEQGANNINLVTPDHYLPLLRIAMKKAREEGLRLPFILNLSAYENVTELQAMEGLCDIYLADFKYWKQESAGRYSHAPDYPEVAKKAIREMVRQQPDCRFSKDGKLRSGVIVRHLLMPGMVKEGEQIVRYLFENYGTQIYLSLMRQFTPFERLGTYPELNRTVTKREYRRLLDFALELGVTQAFIQEEGASRESFIPIWDGTGLEG